MPKKTVAIQKERLKSAGYHISKEKSELGIFYAISKNEKTLLEVLQRKEKGVIVINRKGELYCDKVWIKQEDGPTINKKKVSDKI